MLSKEGGIESFIRLVEERAKKEQKIKQLQKIESQDESGARESRGTGLSKKGKKKVKKGGMNGGGSEYVKRDTTQ